MAIEPLRHRGRHKWRNTSNHNRINDSPPPSSEEDEAKEKEEEEDIAADQPIPGEQAIQPKTELTNEVPPKTAPQQSSACCHRKAGEKIPLVTLLTFTTYDICWQDSGLLEERVASERLKPEYLAADEHLFLPGDSARLKSGTLACVCVWTYFKVLGDGGGNGSVVTNKISIRYRGLRTNFIECFTFVDVPQITEETSKQWAWTDTSTNLDNQSPFCIISAVNSKAMLCTVRWFDIVKTASCLE